MWYDITFVLIHLQASEAPNGSSPRAELAPYKALSLRKGAPKLWNGFDTLILGDIIAYVYIYIYTSTVSISILGIFYHVFLYPGPHLFVSVSILILRLHMAKHEAKCIDLVNKCCLETHFG